ncbi:MAG: bifunctional diguanylate cyclase/phosphodiesterase [Sphingomonas fennica]
MNPPQPANDSLSMTDIAHAMALADGMEGSDRLSDWQRRRQQLLDALPIAAGLYARLPDAGDGPDPADIIPICCNMRMEQILSGRGGRIDASWITRRLAHFLATDVESEDLDWHDDEVGQRHFAVRMHRLAPGEDGSRRCVVSLVDRTAQVETERSLRTEMLHDSLTGLPNRLAFNEAVEEAIGPNGDGSDYAVLICDLTRFSRINECMGSMAGDELIITVARRLIASLRDGDILARLGGDEFAILLRLNGQSDALLAARRIIATFSSPVRLSDLEIRVDCAVGCAVSDARVAGAADLIRNAQIALKRAKRSGEAEIYQAGETNAARRRFSLETELRRAIDRGDLTLAYQPLIDLDNGKVSGFEALARWTPDGLPPVPPGEFIPVAEESGLIVPLGRWAIDTAARTLADWDRAAGKPLPISLSVNVSPVQLQRDDVAALAGSALTQYGVDGRRLTLELTESSLIADPDRALEVVTALKALDCSIAMDDFGTGYSSLALLQKLPIDILKIDRSFVSGMLGDRDAVAIVRAVLSLADALGMHTTAEGIETVELAQTLTALGCTTGQGYYWARPLPAADAYAFLAARA